MLRRIIPAVALCAILLPACSKSEPENQTTDPAALAAASRDELEDAVKDRNELLQLMTEIQEYIDVIRDMKVVVGLSTSETLDRRQQLKDDIVAMQQALIEKQEQLVELEKKLSSSNLYSANLQNTIATLRAQIERQSAEIERLNEDLTVANQRIKQLGTAVDSLNTTVQNVSSERDAAQQQSVELSNELNTCYYAIGTSKELKEHKILESGFLRKTKIMEGEFDQNFFTTADKRTLTSIPLHSKKAEVMSKQPADSYSLTEVNGQMVLKILNPTKFWNKSNYLVVKID